ncbi:hypothetical protein HOY80DRAFT_1139787 [Tuber brumale]|nr:hypothetical protein HOY80DRAFT_1139787 [Tuber brumale]
MSQLVITKALTKNGYAPKQAPVELAERILRQDSKIASPTLPPPIAVLMKFGTMTETYTGRKIPHMANEEAAGAVFSHCKSPFGKPYQKTLARISKSYVEFNKPWTLY